MTISWLTCLNNQVHSSSASLLHSARFSPLFSLLLRSSLCSDVRSHSF